MANKSSYQDSETKIDGVNSTAVLQVEAIRDGRPELALLLPSKEPLKAAALYYGLKEQQKENDFNRTLQMEEHQVRLECMMLKTQAKIQQREQQRQQEEMTVPEPEYVIDLR